MRNSFKLYKFGRQIALICGTILLLIRAFLFTYNGLIPTLQISVHTEVSWVATIIYHIFYSFFGIGLLFWVLGVDGIVEWLFEAEFLRKKIAILEAEFNLNAPLKSPHGKSNISPVYKRENGIVKRIWPDGNNNGDDLEQPNIEH